MLEALQDTTVVESAISEPEFFQLAFRPGEQMEKLYVDGMRGGEAEIVIIGIERKLCQCWEGEALEQTRARLVHAYTETAQAPVFHWLSTRSDLAKAETLVDLDIELYQRLAGPQDVKSLVSCHNAFQGDVCQLVPGNIGITF